jgi:hypothetical protein
VVQFLASQAGISATLGRISEGADYPGYFGRIIWPEWRPSIKGAGSGCPPGSSYPSLGFPQPPPPPPLRRRHRSSGHPLGRSSPEVVLFHLGRAFTKPFLQWMRVFFLTLGCDFTYACSWCLALYLLISCCHESCCMIFFSRSINLCAVASLRKNFEGTGLSAPWPDNPAWHSSVFLNCCHQVDLLGEDCSFILHDS